MAVKNEMETAVRSEVLKQKRGQGGGSWASWVPLEVVSQFVPFLRRHLPKTSLSCRCPLCTTDAVALSLTLLPPCYCRADHYGLSLGKVSGEEVQQRVVSALRKVELRPRHPSRQPVPEASQIRLVDFGLREGARMIGPLLKRIEEACDCAKCREDTLAFGLNRYSPKYGVVVQGKMRIPLHHMEFIRHELLSVLSEAARTIATNPRHGGKDRD